MLRTKMEKKRTWDWNLLDGRLTDQALWLRCRVGQLSRVGDWHPNKHLHLKCGLGRVACHWSFRFSLQRSALITFWWEQMAKAEAEHSLLAGIKAKPKPVQLHCGCVVLLISAFIGLQYWLNRNFRVHSPAKKTKKQKQKQTSLWEGAENQINWLGYWLSQPLALNRSKKFLPLYFSDH